MNKEIHMVEASGPSNNWREFCKETSKAHRERKAETLSAFTMGTLLDLDQTDDVSARLAWEELIE